VRLFFLFRRKSSICAAISFKIAVAFFDGAFEGGRAALGAVVYSEGERIHQVAESVPAGPQLSCNVAEYCGAINVLRFFQRKGITQGSIYGDSMLVVKQLNGA